MKTSLKGLYRYIKVISRRKYRYFAFKCKVRLSAGIPYLWRWLRLSVKRNFIYMRLRFLRRLHPVTRNQIIRDIYLIIKQSKDPDLVDRNVGLFALSTIKKTRWYHKSVDMWLLYNSLPLADHVLSRQISKYLKAQEKHYLS